MSMSMVTSELGARHCRALLQRASCYRPAKSASPARQHPRASWLTVCVRPVRPGDSPLLTDIFARLSPASRLARFLSSKRGLTTAELRYFTDVGHHSHEALTAITRLHGEPLGVARFIRDPREPTSADVAIEVVDEWQNRSAGALLATRLPARATRAHLIVPGADLSRQLPLEAATRIATAGDVTPVTHEPPFPAASPCPSRPRDRRSLTLCRVPTPGVRDARHCRPRSGDPVRPRRLRDQGRGRQETPPRWDDRAGLGHAEHPVRPADGDRRSPAAPKDDPARGAGESRPCRRRNGVVPRRRRAPVTSPPTATP
jgi:hypothetical protein